MTTKAVPYIPYKWELMILLWVAFFLNMADRQLFSIVLPLIKSDLDLTDADLGLIASVLFWTLAVMLPVAGYAGDVFSKKWIISSALLFWSSATLCTGLSTTAVHLVLLRSVATGGGEAFYAPSAFALIAKFHQRTRALAMSIHQTSVYVGFILSGSIGGYIAQTWGWRTAFYCFGVLGILVAGVLFFRLKDRPEDAPQETPDFDKSPRVSPLKALSVLVLTPTSLLLTVGYTCMIFVYLAYLVWTPTFLSEKFGLSPAHAGFSSMFYFHVCAFLGVLAGGRLSDLWAQRRPRVHLEVQCVAMLLGCPFIYLLGRGSSQAITYVGLAGFGLFRGLYDSNIYTSLFDVIPPRYRATANGLMSMFGFLVGAASPYLMGKFKAELGLSAEFQWLAVVHVLAAVAIFLAITRFYARDYYDEDAAAADLQ